MVDNPPAGFPQITPYLLYEDVEKALTFLVDTFGFKERYRMNGPDGKVFHAEVELGNGVVMVGDPGGGYANPKHLCGATQLVYVNVDDVDAHFAHVKRAGAQITSEPSDEFCGDRTYRSEDPEGHIWRFAQHVKDADPEDMHP